MGTANIGHRSSVLARPPVQNRPPVSAPSSTVPTPFCAFAMVRDSPEHGAIWSRKVGFHSLGCVLGLVLGTIVATTSVGVAAPRLEDHIEKTTLAPPAEALKAYAEKPKDNLKAGFSPEQIVGNPQILLEFIKSQPERLDARRMEPAVVLTTQPPAPLVSQPYVTDSARAHSYFLS